MTHKKDGFMVLKVRELDEVWIGSVRIIVKQLGRINKLTIQAPKDLKIETVQPWRKRGGV